MHIQENCDIIHKNLSKHVAVVPRGRVGHNPCVSPSRGKAPLSFESKPHFKISEVAHLFGLSVQTLHYWLKSGRIRSRERTAIRGSYLIPRQELVRLLAEAGREVPGLWERRRPKVLLIDGSPAIRRLGRLAARSQEYPLRLKAAATIEDGLLLAGEFHPEVILLGMRFPKGRMGGPEGLEFLHVAKQTKDTRVVAMVDDPGAARKIERSDWAGVLRKPFGLAELRRAIWGENPSGILQDLEDFRPDRQFGMSLRPRLTPLINPSEESKR